MPPSLRSIVTIAAVHAAACASCASAAQRTFVSTAGHDANPCSIASPCRSFAAALAQTEVDGEIVVLDSGGYGSVTIAQSVSITSPAGVYAGISVFTGTDGVDIATAGVSVGLRGLTIVGLGGNRGIFMTQGARLDVADCVISGLPTGIHVSASGATATIVDSVMRDGTIGLRATGSVNMTADRVRITGNTSDGATASNGATLVVRDSVVSHNGSSGIEATGNATSTTRLVADGVMAVGNTLNGVNLRAEAGTGTAQVIAQIARSTFTGGQYGVHGYNLTGNLLDATVADNVIAGNSVAGLRLVSGNASGRMTSVGNRITDNAVGVRLVTNATLRTAGDNVLDRNGVDTQFDPGTTVVPAGSI